jgi:adenylate cyclase
MAELRARGGKSEDRWRRTLREGERIVLGRNGTWPIPWERFLSAEHAEVIWRNDILEVRALPTARNPIFVNGRPATSFVIRSGEHFVIGETVFTVVPDEANTVAIAPEPLHMRTFAAEELRQVQFRDAPRRIDVLSRLPDVISGAANDAELFIRLGNMLLAGIPRADVVAIVAAEQPDAPPEVLHWDRRRTTTTFQPSQRLLQEALRRRQSVLHVWIDRDKNEAEAFTAQANVDWAFCSPLPGEACKGWGIYVAGRFRNDMDTIAAAMETSNAQEDLKFTELAASILSALRQVQRLQQQQASLGHFFSPPVLRTLADKDAETVLVPRQTDVTVLFCDLRGFSRESEKYANNLLALLERVSKALGVMTQNILDQGGVIGDFQGDAAMGFWGWPLAQPDAIERACLAALTIRTTFEASAHRVDHPLAGFQVGIGIATGPAVAGKIGSRDQAKIGVFGPVVNLAARLEGMTKLLGAAILIDETTARHASAHLPLQTGRCRRLVNVKPYGMDTALIDSELLPPLAEYPILTDEHLAIYEEALNAFRHGQWSQALALLHRVPPQDCAKDFLTEFILQHKRNPPPDWNGVVQMQAKK